MKIRKLAHRRKGAKKERKRSNQVCLTAVFLFFLASSLCACAPVRELLFGATP